MRLLTPIVPFLLLFGCSAPSEDKKDNLEVKVQELEAELSGLKKELAERGLIEDTSSGKGSAPKGAKVSEKKVEKRAEGSNGSGSSSSGKPAPLRSPVIEKIAKTMDRIATRDDVSKPMEAGVAKRVLGESFKEHGYSYSATLHHIAENGFSMGQKQLVGFVLAPVQADEENYKKVYSGQELKDVERIIEMMN